MRILLINGPNLNLLGTREPEIYGRETLADIVARVEEKAREAGAEVKAFQSNSEGAIIDFIQAEAPAAGAIILNAGALTHYSHALRDVIEACRTPTIEVHISNVYARERFRRRSVLSAVCAGVIVGFGWRGYVLAVDAAVAIAQGKKV